ncbi:hypothetical protein V8E36_006060 [Tilletia maclaganii]
MDLIKHYDGIFPALLARKARKSELSAAQRKIPVRKRTKSIDQRLSRSQMLAAQAAQHGKDVPPLPAFISGGAAAATKVAGNVVDRARRLGQRLLTDVENAIASTSSPLSVSPGEERGGDARSETLKGPAPSGGAAAGQTRTPSSTTASSAPASIAKSPVLPASSSNVARLSRQFGGNGGCKSPVIPAPVVGSANAASGGGGVPVTGVRGT